MSYTNTETVPLNALYLRLFPNTPGYGGEMSVSNLTLDGDDVHPVRELQGSALRVDLDPPLAPGMHATLTLEFTLALPTEGQGSSEGYRQLGIYEGVVALANAYPIVPVYDDGGWNVELAPSYGDATFSDVAFFDVSITAPRTMTLAASGTCARAEAGSAETTWSCVAAPMRDFNAVLGERYQLESRDVGSIAVNSLFYEGHAGGGAAALDYATRAVRLFDTRIGPYPFAELDVVETPTLAGGIEYPGLVVINQSYYDSDQGVSNQMEWVVVHEVLHQWWYSLVGNDQVDEPWLDEALVQYCTLLYYEEQYGQDVAESLLDSVFRQAYQELREANRDQPVGLPVAAYSRGAYGSVVYQKGPLYFHNLRQQVGTETFWQILKTYFEQNRYAIARPEAWLAAVETVTGSEYRALYDEWIQETGG
jgi:aminopeptidase N